MRRADAVWRYSAASSTWTDFTQDVGDGRVPAALAQNDKLYIGCSDWTSGLYLQVDEVPAGTPNIVVETWDGRSGEWKIMPLQERVTQASIGHVKDPTAYNFDEPGVVNWGASQWLWTSKTTTRQWPELKAPPDEVEYYWVRLRNLSAVSVSIARLLPVMYNTYASHNDVASFLGLSSSFSEDVDPTATLVRGRIRAAEDWLDNKTRRSWRLRQVYSERHTFNPNGIRLRGIPAWFVQRMEVWAGDELVVMREGRNKDFYLDTESGMIYFTRLALGRGLPWSSVQSRYLRLPRSMELDYVWGADFEMAYERDLVQGIVLKRVAADIVTMQDAVSLFETNPDAVPKPDKIKTWRAEAEEEADRLVSIVLA